MPRSGEQLLEISIRQAESQIPAHPQLDHLWREPKPGKRRQSHLARRTGPATLHHDSLAAPVTIGQRNSPGRRTRHGSPQPDRSVTLSSSGQIGPRGMRQHLDGAKAGSVVWPPSWSQYLASGMARAARRGRAIGRLGAIAGVRGGLDSAQPHARGHESRRSTTS